MSSPSCSADAFLSFDSFYFRWLRLDVGLESCMMVECLNSSWFWREMSWVLIRSVSNAARSFWISCHSSTIKAFLASSDSCFRSGSFFIPLSNVYLVLLSRGLSNYIESYGRAKYEWLKKLLELPNGIPSHDTIARVFSRLKPEEFQKCFLSWIQSISCFNPGEVIAIDGKTLRHSYPRGGDKKAIHMVSAWATSQKLVLAG